MKARVAVLVLFATATGFCLGREEIHTARLAVVLLGTGLACCGAAALNQALEVECDRRMTRTRGRPLPNGEVTHSAAIALGAMLGTAGIAVLALGATGLSACLAGLALAVYVAGYTPLKRRSRLCIPAGALAGALPPLVGNAACDGSIDEAGGLLFAILFAWQLPHLLSIAWVCRDDYARAGFVVLGRAKSHVAATGALALGSIILLGVLTLLPAGMGNVESGYGAGILFPNTLLLFCGAAFCWRPDRATARRLFLASLLYLPAALGLLLWAWR